MTKGIRREKMPEIGVLSLLTIRPAVMLLYSNLSSIRFISPVIALSLTRGRNPEVSSWRLSIAK